MASNTTTGQDYNSILMNRLGQIQSIGDQQTSWQRLKAQQDQQKQANMDRMAQLDAQYASATDQRVQQQQMRDNTPFGKFKGAILQQESGGNYGATNSIGALGGYQVMPANINGTKSGWDYEALGRDVTTQQYLASPELQEQIVSYKLQQYYNSYGPAGAAVAWYAGPTAAANYARSGQASGRPQSGGPSVSGYVQQILARMGL